MEKDQKKYHDSLIDVIIDEIASQKIAGNKINAFVIADKTIKRTGFMFTPGYVSDVVNDIIKQIG